MLKLMPIIWWSLVLLALPAWAQVTPGTACGAAGTGYVQGPTGRPVLQARTAEQAAGTRVASNGEWTVCEAAAPAKEPEACGGTGAFRKWVVGPHECTSELKYATGLGDPARDNGIRHGQRGEWSQWQGPLRGRLIEQCHDGKRTEVERTCKRATHCDYTWATVKDGRTYVYSGGTQPAPIGARVDALSKDGKAIRLQCGPDTRFSVVR